MSYGKIRVVVIDDSAFVRKFVTEAISSHPEIEVVGHGANGQLGLEKIAETLPDAVTCDVEMPVMDGLETVVEIRKRWPDLPVIMLSTLTAKGAATSIEALIRGATDYAEKPAGTSGPAEAIKRLEEQLVPKLLMYVGQKRMAAAARAPRPETSVRAPSVTNPDMGNIAAAVAEARAAAQQGGGIPPAASPPVSQPRPVVPQAQPRPAERPAWGSTDRPSTSGVRGIPNVSSNVGVPSQHSPSTSGVRAIPNVSANVSVPAPKPAAPSAGKPRPIAPGKPDLIVIGVSTGGPNALADLLPSLPRDLPVPVLIVQHMPPLFTKALADRLNSKCALTVDEARDGVTVAPGEVWIAPGDFHMVVEGKPGRFTLKLNQQPQENGCRPAVDVLFRSALTAVGGRALAVILTGMGQDGLKGADALTNAGAQLIAQDEASSVVWGMPGAVARAGLAHQVLPLSQIAAAIVRAVRG